MKYNPQKHHRRSIRLSGYDYSQCGAYFITICTRNGLPILANPQKNDVDVGVEGAVGVALAATQHLAATHHLATSIQREPDSVHRFELTAIGEIVEHNWRKLPERFPMVSLDDYVIMPNHFHGILFINECDQSRQSDTIKRVAARATPTTPTLGMIVGAFKSMSINDTIADIEKNRLDMIGKIWQRNYFEKVIKNERELENIRTYIRNNSYNWEQDNENPKHSDHK
jgi:putative transposase